jgi:hypothetical protein
MDFSTVSIVKHPIDRVWTVMRDDLADLADLMDDIESIHVELREEGPPIFKIVNVWTAHPRLPESVVRYLGSETFSWTDRAEWNEKRMECLWSIEPHRFRDRIRCVGATRFSPAMGGRGTRVVFSGEIEWNSQNLPGLPSMLEEAVYAGAEALVKSLIPKNFRKITDAIAAHLDALGGE